VQNVSLLNLPKAGFKIISDVIDKDVAIQICSSNDEEILSALKIGASHDSHPCFSLGTGLAMEPSPAPFHPVPLIISDGFAHNYYSFERREQGKEHVAIHVEGVQTDSDATFDKTNILIIIDKNKNRIFDEGEYWFAKVNWI
jgi:hypothetical protein